MNSDRTSRSCYFQNRPKTNVVYKRKLKTSDEPWMILYSNRPMRDRNKDSNDNNTLIPSEFGGSVSNLLKGNNDNNNNAKIEMQNYDHENANLEKEPAVSSFENKKKSRIFPSQSMKKAGESSNGFKIRFSHINLKNATVNPISGIVKAHVKRREFNFLNDSNRNKDLISIRKNSSSVKKRFIVENRTIDNNRKSLFKNKKQQNGCINSQTQNNKIKLTFKCSTSSDDNLSLSGPIFNQNNKDVK